MIEALCNAMDHFDCNRFVRMAGRTVKLFHDNHMQAIVLLHLDGSWTRLDKAA